MKDFISESSAIQVKKRQQLVSMMHANKNAFDLTGDDIVEVSRENDSLRKKIGFYDDKWLRESQLTLLKKLDDDKKANSIMSEMETQL